MKQLKQILIVFALTAISASAQGLISRVGPDTGGGGGTAGRTILRAEMNLVRSLTNEELRSGIANRLSIDTADSPLNFNSKFALDLENVEEITLKDGTVLKVREIREKALDNLTSPE